MHTSAASQGIPLGGRAGGQLGGGGASASSSAVSVAASVTGAPSVAPSEGESQPLVGSHSGGPASPPEPPHASSEASEASEASYTVTACDVMQGHLVAVYDTTDGTLHLLTQSFGPMAYFGVIVQSVLCLYYATASSSLTNAPALVALWLQASCALLLVTQGVPFLTAADAMHAVLWLAVGIALALHSWLAHAEDEGTEACLYALGSLATLMYRTPEHAYAGVLCAVLVVRQWEKLLLVKKRKSPLFNLFLTTVALATLADTGVAPQCTPPERWPFYAGLGVYMGFALALLRSSTEP